MRRIRTTAFVASWENGRGAAAPSMSITYFFQHETLTYFFLFGIIWQDLGWDLKLLMHSFYEAIHDFSIQFLSKVIEIIVLHYCMLGTYDQCRFFHWLIFFNFA